MTSGKLNLHSLNVHAFIILENGCVLAKTVATNGLGDLVSLSKIHGFIRLSSNKKLFQKGEPVPFIPTKNIY